MLFFVFNAAKQNGKTQHEQDVPDDRSGDGGFDHISQTFGKCDTGDDQFGSISESGIEQSAQTFANAGRERFGGTADPTGDWNDPESGANKKRSGAATSRPEAQQDRERNKDKKPVEGRFEFQKSGNFATYFS
jgi:hypothetical protein